jgi:ADP-ribosylglycohydrolase
MAEARAMDRAFGAFAGVALGDAMGMPTQTLSRAQIAAFYGAIEDLRDAVPEQPVSAGLEAGTITDDTEQSLLLARHLLDRKGAFDEQAWAQTLLVWDRDTRARGVNDLLGPSTRRAIEQLLRGICASETGRFGTTNGAAMRIIPVAIATPPEPLSALIDEVEASCRLTHNTSEAIGSASAVSAVVSAGIEGSSFEAALPLALAAAREGERRGAPAASGSMEEHIEKALALAAGKTGLDAAVEAAAAIGTSVAALQSIPMAFAVVRLASGDPWQAALISAMLGDDTDTIGAISCGMAGACAGFLAIPPEKWARVEAVNGLDLQPLVAGLLAIRRTRKQRCLRSGVAS